VNTALSSGLLYISLRRSTKLVWLYSCTLCLKNDTDVAHYNFNGYQRILVIFGRDVAERVH